MKVRFATADDLDTLIKVRFDYFQSENWEVPAEKRQQIRTQLLSYFPAHLNRDFFAALAEDEAGNLGSAAFLVLSERPANLSFPTGKTGLILNVLTYPAYRRMGYATETMQLLIAEAKRRDLSLLELSASQLGMFLYRKLGFQERHSPRFTEMRLSLL